MTRSIVVALACLASSAVAFADDRIGITAALPPLPPPPPAPPPPPPPPPRPGLTLKEGGMLAAVTFEIGLNTGKQLQPVSIAPDLSYGMTSDLTVSLVH